MQATKPVTKPKKQRKMLHQAPDHIRYKFFGSPLSPQLKASHKVKSLSVRSGDTVRIMRGDHKGFEGKINRVDRKKYRIYVEGLTREKVDGTTIFVPVHPSKVMITSINLDDKWRKKILERRKEAHKKVEEAMEIEIRERPPKEVAEVKEIVEEKPKAKKTRKRKKKTIKRVAAVKKERAAEKAKKGEKPKKKKTRAKRKSTMKTVGGK